MKPAAVAVPKDAPRETPEFHERPQPIGYVHSDYSLLAPEGMRPEDLTDPAAWTMAKQLTPQDRGSNLRAGDCVRVVHPHWFAVVIVDRAGPLEPCYVVVQSVTPRKSYGEAERELIPRDHFVDQDPRTGFYLATFARGDERVRLGEPAPTWQAAVDICRDHAARTPQRKVAT